MHQAGEAYVKTGLIREVYSKVLELALIEGWMRRWRIALILPMALLEIFLMCWRNVRFLSRVMPRYLV